MVLLSNKCVWKTRNPHQSRLPDGPILPQTDSGHFAVATLGSYPATISCTTRVLRHVLANALCDITSLINEDGAKHRLRGFTPRNRVANRTKKSIAHHHDRQYSLSYNNELYLCYKNFILLNNYFTRCTVTHTDYIHSGG